MYHISKDKRAIRSADFIYKGLLQCLKYKSFDQITVTDVQKASGVARTTIYRCFETAHRHQPTGYYLCLPHEKC